MHYNPFDKDSFPITQTPVPKVGPDQINVALFPFVPDPQPFKDNLVAMWKQLYPEVTLNFIDYNAYKADPPDNLEVFAFDTIFLSDFVSKGFLQSIPRNVVKNASDLMPYAYSACFEGNTLYALPYLGCANVLFYRAGDSQMDQIQTINQLYTLIGDAASDPKPPMGRGFLADLSGITTDTSLYTMSFEETYNAYSPDPPMPPPDKLDAQSIANIHLFTRMAGKQQAASKDAQRIDWFTREGLGRAMLGITEYLYRFPKETINSYTFRSLPLSYRQADRQLYYTDGMGINSKMDPSKVAMAYDLINLIASTDYLLRSILPADPATANPQYLMPVRISQLNYLAGQYPLYARMRQMIQARTPTPFRLGVKSRDWIAAVGPTIQARILGTTDIDATPDFDKPALPMGPPHTPSVKRPDTAQADLTLFFPEPLYVRGVQIAAQSASLSPEEYRVYGLQNGVWSMISGPIRFSLTRETRSFPPVFVTPGLYEGISITGSGINKVNLLP